MNQPLEHDPQFRQATQLHAAGRLPEALRAYQALITSRPGNPILLFHMGRALRDARQPHAAIQAFGQALRAAPGNPRIHELLGMTLLNVGHVHAAIQHLETALPSQPGSVNIRVHLATAHRLAGNLDQALELFDGILRDEPGNLSCAAGKADILETLRRHDEAVAIIDPLITSSPNSFHVVETFARLARADGRQQEAVKAIETYFQSGPRQDLPLLARLRTTQGQLLEDLGRFDEAFETYAAARKLLAMRFDPDAHVRLVSGIIEVFTPQRIEQLKAFGAASSRPVLIVGMPRSGTSLCEEILACHPDVFGAGELPFLQRFSEQFHFFTSGAASSPGTPGPGAPKPGDAYPGAVARLTAEQARNLAEFYERHMAEKAPPDAKRVIDKFPGNYLHLGLFAILFPHGRIIHLRRHPLDVAISCFGNMLIGPFSWAGTLENIALAYRQYRRIMDHWRSCLGPQVLDVVYEDLVTDTQPQVRRILDFLELPWDERCLRFHESRRAVRTPSRDQVRRPMNNSSIGRWRRFEHHLAPLKTELSEFL